MDSKVYYVYILASLTRALYIGITSDLELRAWQHKEGIFGGHTSKYRINRLVYFETFSNPTEAIAREKELKRWKRFKKIELIERNNAAWVDLSENWGKDATATAKSAN
jgi:putative endonuclease